VSVTAASAVFSCGGADLFVVLIGVQHDTTQELENVIHAL
jgi:hypothetical protein